MSEAELVTMSFVFLFIGTVLLKVYEDRPKAKPISLRRRSVRRWDF